MVPQAKIYSTGDLARREGWKPGDVVKDDNGVKWLVVHIHKGYVMFEDSSGDCFVIDDEMDFTRVDGGSK